VICHVHPAGSWNAGQVRDVASFLRRENSLFLVVCVVVGSP
jgi:hypothetical protein